MSVAQCTPETSLPATMKAEKPAAKRIAAFLAGALSSLLPAQVGVNGPGRIREALGDILGNLSEQILADHADEDWLVGESAGAAIWSMSAPNLSQRPAFTGDALYLPLTSRPSRETDWGGIHTDSSLTGLVAYLGLRAGMNAEEERALWTKVALAMTAKTDEAQLKAMIPWAAVQVGLTDYRGALIEAINSVRLGESLYQPTRAKDGYGLIGLELPEAQSFANAPAILSVEGESQGKPVSAKSWSLEGSLIRFMAPEGTYEARLSVEGPDGEAGLSFIYDGSSWQQEGEADPAELSLPAGESLTLANDGLELVDSVMAQQRISGLMG